MKKKIKKTGATKGRKPSRRAGVFKPTREVLTVMFVDVVGFSLRDSKQPPEKTFKELRGILTAITSLVKRHHGIVDRTLGDGVLCYFRDSDHAFRALNCAVEVQRKMLHEHRNPLRIGINTTVAVVGNLGTKSRKDVTIIGTGVNLAKRFETACDSYRVLLGPDTKHALGNRAEAFSLIPRLVQIKHRVELQEAYEHDPFQETPHLVKLAREAFWKSLEVPAVSRRLTLNEEPVDVHSSLGNGWLVNVSERGLAIDFDNYLAPGLIFQLQVAPGTELGRKLEAQGLNPLVMEVRWGHPIDDRFRLGLALKNLTNDKRQRFLNEITHAVEGASKIRVLK